MCVQRLPTWSTKPLLEVARMAVGKRRTRRPASVLIGLYVRRYSNSPIRSRPQFRLPMHEERICFCLCTVKGAAFVHSGVHSFFSRRYSMLGLSEVQLPGMFTLGRHAEGFLCIQTLRKCLQSDKKKGDCRCTSTASHFAALLTREIRLININQLDYEYHFSNIDVSVRRCGP